MNKGKLLLTGEWFYIPNKGGNSSIRFSGFFRLYYYKFNSAFHQNLRGGVLLKKSVLAIIFMVFPIIVTGCANNVEQATVKTQQDEKANAVGSSNNRLEQVAAPIIKITKEQAVTKAQQNLLSLLSIKTGDLEKAELVNNVFNMSEYWDVQFKGISVNIDSVSGTVLAISPFLRRVTPEQFTIKDNTLAEKTARELYSKLQAPPEYKLTSLKMTSGGDFWTSTWQKEVIPGVFSKYESVNLMFASDNGELMGYNLFNTPAKSLEVKITQDQAVNTAKTLAETKGFSGFIEAKLDVEQPNSLLEGSIKSADYVTLVWAVTYKNTQSEFSNTMVVYVDCSTGLVVGGDQK